MGELMTAMPAGGVDEPVSYYLAGMREARPWGNWEVLGTGARYVLKRITVLPGQRLSLQYHNHRSEYWTILQGLARVEIDGAARLAESGSNVCVPLGAKHRIHNVGQEELVFLEVQMGHILDENDIIRLSDDYGRSTAGA